MIAALLLTPQTTTRLVITRHTRSSAQEERGHYHSEWHPCGQSPVLRLLRVSVLTLSPAAWEAARNKPIPSARLLNLKDSVFLSSGSRAMVCIYVNLKSSCPAHYTTLPQVSLGDSFGPRVNGTGLSTLSMHCNPKS